MRREKERLWIVSFARTDAEGRKTGVNTSTHTHTHLCAQSEVFLWLNEKSFCLILMWKSVHSIIIKRSTSAFNCSNKFFIVFEFVHSHQITIGNTFFLSLNRYRSRNKRNKCSSQMTVKTFECRYVLRMFRLNRLIIVNVRSSVRTRHVYSPASSSEVSDRMKVHAHAYLTTRRSSSSSLSIDLYESMSRTSDRVLIVFDHHRSSRVINVPWVHKNRPKNRISKEFPWIKSRQTCLWAKRSGKSHVNSASSPILVEISSNKSSKEKMDDGRRKSVKIIEICIGGISSA